jgi:hypothetical protein
MEHVKPENVAELYLLLNPLDLAPVMLALVE